MLSSPDIRALWSRLDYATPVRRLCAARLRIVLLSTALLCLLVQTGCRRDKATHEEQARRELGIAMVEPATIDPHRLSGGPGRKIACNLFLGLTALSSNATVEPGCARRWTRSENGKEWTFELRDDARWSDGTPITAQTFVDSWLRATTPETENPNAEMFDIIAGAAARRGGDVRATFGAAASSDYLLTIRTSRPIPDLPKRLASSWASPVPIHQIEQHGEDWLRPEHIVVNGAYTLKEYVRAVHMRFRKRSNSLQPATIEDIVVRFTDNPTDALRWLELGTIDWADNLVPQEAMGRLRGEKNSPLRSSPYLGLTYIIPNFKRTGLDLEVRRALNLSIDRARLVKHVLDGSQRPLSRPIPRDLLNTSVGPQFNPSLARSLLGASPSLRTRHLALTFYNGGRNRALAEALQRQWKEHIGMEVELHGMEWKSFLTTTAMGDFDLALFTLGGYDAADLLSVFASDSPNNRGSYHSKVVDSALRAGAMAPTEASQHRELSRAERELMEDVAVISLFQLTRHSLVRPTIDGWTANVEDHHPWHALRWK